MFCKKCGAEIADNSVYCSKCGQEQDKNNNSSSENDKEDKILNRGIKISLCIFLFLIFALIFVTIIFPLMFPYGIERGFVRKASNEDIEIDYELNLSSLAFEIVITPNKDIKELEIYICFENKDGHRVYSHTETVGTVKQGIQVHEQFQVTELTASNMFNCKVSVLVTEGYVPYLQ